MAASVARCLVVHALPQRSEMLCGHVLRVVPMHGARCALHVACVLIKSMQCENSSLAQMYEADVLPSTESDVHACGSAVHVCVHCHLVR